MSFIKIITPIPHSQDVKEYNGFNKFEAKSMHGQLPVIWDSAKDCIIKDRHGNSFLDFTSGICVTNVGHGNENIIRGLKYYLDKPLLHTYTFPCEVRYGFLRELIELCYPKGKAFLVSSGTEAVEVSCKIMRMYGQKKDPNCRYIISFKDSMHGRSMLAEQLKGITKDNLWAFSFDTSIINLKIGQKIENLEDIKRNICGIIIESYQGWSATFYPKDYVQYLVKWAKENDIIVCFDEIQGGFGRTGKLFAYEHYDIPTPDLICIGKGVSSSLPLSGVIGRSDLLDLPEIGSMSSTHSANPLSCIAGLENLLEFQRLNILENVNKLDNLIRKEVYTWNYDDSKIECINGIGLLWAFVTRTKEQANEIAWNCFKRGLLTILTHKNSVKICPPLIITGEGMKEGLNIIKEEIQ